MVKSSEKAGRGGRGRGREEGGGEGRGGAEIDDCVRRPLHLTGHGCNPGLPACVVLCARARACARACVCEIRDSTARLRRCPHCV